MFEQFRTRFPQGGLISELIQIDHGKYIVRVSVQNEGLTLATGLAAAETVEQAEDQARTRALAVLDLVPSPTIASQGEPQPPITPPRKQPAAKPPTPSPAPLVEETQISASNGTSHVSNAGDAEISEPATPVSSPELEPTQQSSSDSDSEPQEIQSDQTEASAEQAAIMDSSDIIARTNVELRRLNWTSEQGRKFLEETYGKRSRSLLSESELLEFLQYLEQQPTPPQA